MDSNARPRKPVLLHVEDDDATAFLLRLALREISLDVDVFRTCDGEDAIKFLTRTGVFAAAPPPDIVVLDLHLPKKNGHDVLTEVRQQSALHGLPVVMLTSSRVPKDRERALLLGANEYIYKPTDLEGFLGVATQILRYLPFPTTAIESS
jgi:DNA-binding response OmpR family regulator